VIICAYPLRCTDEEISAGLAARLVRYAERVLDAEGFLAAVKHWNVKVGTEDADRRPADRCYWVCWTNEKGGSLSVVGILTSKGWPHLDHGMKIERA
jgi:hypothetical protein